MDDIKERLKIEKMRKGGKILAKIVKEIVVSIAEGVSTYKLDVLALDLCKKYNVKPAFLHYKGYPATACFGVNDTVVHGISSKNEVLKKGDIISVDMGVIYKGYYTDKAVTVGVGKISKEASRLINATRDCLYAAIRKVKAGNTIGDLGHAIQSVAELAGFSVVKQMVGHGVGKALHEEPKIPGFGNPDEGVELKKGMTLAIEAIINQGKDGIRFLSDGWTTKTIDGKLSAIFEDTVLVKKKGAEVLTRND